MLLSVPVVCLLLTGVPFYEYTIISCTLGLFSLPLDLNSIFFFFFCWQNLSLP